MGTKKSLEIIQDRVLGQNSHSYYLPLQDAEKNVNGKIILWIKRILVAP